jgi:hypothetical protein
MRRPTPNLMPLGRFFRKAASHSVHGDQPPSPFRISRAVFGS